jgi:hypothetical protein
MTTVTPEAGQEWVRDYLPYTIKSVEDGLVKMRIRSKKLDVEETLTRFREEVADGNLVHHPTCDYCRLPIRPEELRSNDEYDHLHEGCWYQHASVRDRCEYDVATAGGSMMAAEALRADDPQAHLLGVLGNPARTLHERNDAEALLTHAVSVQELLDAEVRCPNCKEGEVFEMDPDTGDVYCHCGELLQRDDDAPEVGGWI